MRIVYREAPEKFRVLRSVNHTHASHAALNAEYEKWQADFIANHKAKALAKGVQQKLAWPPKLSPRAKSSLERDAEARRKAYGG